MQWVPGTLSLGLSGREVKLTPQLHLVKRSKEAWSSTSTPHYAFMVWCSVKARGRVYVYLDFIKEPGEERALYVVLIVAIIIK
jgi:hypothetical protein